MGFLATALANELGNLRGQYYVALPGALRHELIELVESLEETNSADDPRAVYVEGISAKNDHPNLPVIASDAVLKLRDTEDRVFVWERGSFNPDSSFSQHVRPFLGETFPFADSPGMTLDSFTNMCLRTLHKRFVDGEVTLKNAFREALTLANELSLSVYQSEGNRPLSTTGNWTRWPDGYLIHLSDMLDKLDNFLSGISPEDLTEAHAWEILRLSGIPVLGDASVSNGKLLVKPEVINERQRTDLLKTWDRACSEYIVGSKGLAPFLSAIDKVLCQSDGYNSWHSLNWPTEREKGRLRGNDSLSIEIGKGIASDAYAGSGQLEAARLNWGGVNEEIIKKAIRLLDNSNHTTLGPENKCLEVVSDPARFYIIQTHQASPQSPRHTIQGNKINFVVNLRDLEISSSGQWDRLFVQEEEPSTPNPGDAWIDPNGVEIVMSPKTNVLMRPISTEGSANRMNPEDIKAKVQADLHDGDITQEQADEKLEDLENRSQLGFGRLITKFHLEILYPATISGDVYSSGNWASYRSIQHKYTIRTWEGSHWTAPNDMKNAVNIIIPSPYDYTSMVLSPRAKSPEVTPERNHSYTSNALTDSWQTLETPSVSLSTVLERRILVYDGRVDPHSESWIDCNAIEISLGEDRLHESIPHQLFDVEAQITDSLNLIAKDPSGEVDIVSFSVSGSSHTESCGIISAIKGTTPNLKDPDDSERETLLGQYQDKLLASIKTIQGDRVPNTLFQALMFSSDVDDGSIWPEINLSRSPTYIESGNQELKHLLKSGPREELTRKEEWRKFQESLGKILHDLFFESNRNVNWLSSPDPSSIQGQHIKEYLESHASLIEACDVVEGRPFEKNSDKFWSTFPLSLFIADEDGAIESIFMSPIHPVRLAWSYTACKLSRSLHKEADQENSGATIGTPTEELASLLEGWNIPISGSMPGPSESELRRLIAVPIDHGKNNDFIGWSALSLLTGNGKVVIRDKCQGNRLPWASGTGINGKIVEDSITDYLRSFPNASTLSVELSTVQKSPRSEGVDDSVVKVLAGNQTRKTINGSRVIMSQRLPGGVRIYDSDLRTGTPPKREFIQDVRQSSRLDNNTIFEWNSYHSSDQRPSADISFIENSDVDLALEEGSSGSILGYLPIKRYIQGEVLNISADQNKQLLENVGVSGEGIDPLRLHKLLQKIEHPLPRLRSTFNVSTLGLNANSRWEVIGTFHLDPFQLSDFITNSSTEYGTERFLWEWRPAWLNSDQSLQGRPYFVIAKVPKSLRKGFEENHQINEQEFSKMLVGLGYTGIGLSSLTNKGGTRESAALGFYCTIQLFERFKQQHNYEEDQNFSHIFRLIPIDPVEGYIETLVGKRFGQRADFIGVSICKNHEGSRIRLFPIETKYYGSSSALEPSDSEIDESGGTDQLKATLNHLRELATLLMTPKKTSKANHYVKLHSFATLLDLALSLQGSPREGLGYLDSTTREEIVSDVLNGRFHLDTGKGLLTWFSPGKAGDNHPYSVREGSSDIVFMDPKSESLKEFFWSDSNEETITGSLTETLTTLIGGNFENCDNKITDYADGLLGQINDFLLYSKHPARGGRNVPTAVLAQADSENFTEESLKKIFSASGIDVSFIHVTQTMLKKSTIDAIVPIRDLLKDNGVHDYDSQEQGQESRIYKTSYFVGTTHNSESRTSLFRPSSGNGDPRIWFSDLKDYARAGDVIVLFTHEGHIYLVNSKDSTLLETINHPTTPLGKLVDEIKGSKTFIETPMIEIHSAENEDDEEYLSILEDYRLNPYVLHTSVTANDPGSIREAFDVTDEMALLLKNKGIHDFEDQSSGPANSVEIPAYFVGKDNSTESTASLYKNTGVEQSGRIWFQGLKEYSSPDEDLILIPQGNSLYILNSGIVGLVETISDPSSPLGRLARLENDRTVLGDIEQVDRFVSIGNRVDTGEEIKWPLSTKGNPHLLLAGQPGMGKTTLLLNLCRQMLAAGVKPIVFSYHEDIDEGLSRVSDSVQSIGFDELGFNPLQVSDRTTPYGHLDVASTIREIFSAIYRDLGRVQATSINNAIVESFSHMGWDDQTKDRTKLEEPKFRDFLDILRSHPRPTLGMQTLLASLNELDRYRFFDGEKSGVNLWDSNDPVIIKLHATSNVNVQNAFASLVFYGLYKDMFARGTQKTITHAIIFDEAHRASRLGLIPTMAKECRKYGISLVLASQEARDFDDSLFSTIGNYLVLRLNETDARQIVRNVVSSDLQRDVTDQIKELKRFKAIFFSEGRDYFPLILPPP